MVCWYLKKAPSNTRVSVIVNFLHSERFAIYCLIQEVNFINRISALAVIPRKFYSTRKISHRALEMEDVKDVSVGPMPQSDFLKPLRMNFTQNGRKRFWDFVKVHESVSCLLFNTSRNVLILVKQFRPVVYYNSSSKQSTGDNSVVEGIDWTTIPAKDGVTIELCAGIMDEKLSHIETAKKEVLEECGYDIPLANFEKVINYAGGVGASGDRVTVFYAECTDAMKVNEGGGIASEGELIEVVEMSISEVQKYIGKDYVNSPGGFLFTVMWFLANKAPKC